MLSKFRSLLFNQSLDEDSIRLRVYIDTIESSNDKYLEFDIKKQFNVGSLRNKVKSNSLILNEELFFFINGQFRDDDDLLSNVTNGMNVTDGFFLVYAILVSDQTRQEIDYNLEDYLHRKYSVTNTNSEMDNQRRCSESENSMVFDAICSVCKKRNVSDYVLKLFFCDHGICKSCLKKSIFNVASRINLKCPNRECTSDISDHEIQMALSPSDYEDFSKHLLALVNDLEFKLPKIGWICKMCTCINKPFLKFCAACTENRPDGYKIPPYWKPDDSEMEEMVELNREETLREKMEEEQRMKEEVEKKVHLELLRQMVKADITVTNESTECPICLVDCSAGECVILHSCLHTICKDCLKSYLINVENAKVKCPTENCIGLIEDREISAMLSSDEYQRYQELNMRMAEATESKAYHCREVNCTAWIIRDRNISNFVCPLCKKKNCISCQTIHEDMSCEQYRLIQEAKGKDPVVVQSELYIQGLIDSGKAMKCPGCGILVEKTRGCDGVTCKSCGIMMCWATKGPRWGPKGKGDTSGGCGCRYFLGRKCHPSCRYCH